MRRNLVLFDGVCNLCNVFVDFIIRHRGSHAIYFASLQSPLGQKVLAHIGLPKTGWKTVVFLQDGEVIYESDAVFAILSLLKAPWSLLGKAVYLPAFLRQQLYQGIATNRYSWFGKRETCRLPNVAEKAFFLEDGELRDFL